MPLPSNHGARPILGAGSRRPATMRRVLGSALVASGVAWSTSAYAAPPVVPRPTAPFPIVRIEAHDFAFDLPDTLPAGFVRLRLINRGTVPHEAVLTRLAPQELFDEPLERRDAWLRGGPFPGWADDIGGVGEVAPGDSDDVIVHLASGRYLIACYVPVPDHVPHYRKGMKREIQVIEKPRSIAERAPSPDMSIDLMDYTFRLSAPITPGPHVIRVTNLGPQEHELQIRRVLSGKVGADTLTKSGLQTRPPTRTVPVGGTGFLAPHETAYIVESFSPGDYVLLCHVSDVIDRKSHMAHGMLYVVHVH